MRLGALSSEDCEQVRVWRNQVPNTLRTPFRLTRAMQADFYQSVVSNRHSRHRYYGLYVVDRDGGGDSCVGMGGLTDVAWEAGTAEISLILAPGARGRGWGRYAVYLLLKEGFHALRLAHIYGEVNGSNQAGWAFWKHLADDWGATTTVLPARTFWDGRHWDSLYFDYATLPVWAPPGVPAPELTGVV